MSTVRVLERDLAATLDEGTRAILERRRGSGKSRGWLVRRALLAADLFGLMLAFFVAQRLYPNQDVSADRVDGLLELSLFCVSLPCFVVAAKLYGLYDKDEEQTDHSTTDDFAGVFHLVTVSTWLLYSALYMTKWADPQLPKMFAFWLLAVFAVTMSRVAARAYCRRQIDYLQNTIIVGAGDVGQKIAHKLLKHHEYASTSSVSSTATRRSATRGSGT